MTKSALITGGAGDLARSVRSELEAHGWQVQAPGRRGAGACLDVTDEASVAAYAASCGELDLIVANAGLTRDGLLARQREADWDQVLGVNLDGAARVARHFGPYLRPGGLLLLVGSYSAQHPPAGQVAYASAKAALEGLCKSLAREWGPEQRRVNLLLPGFLETRMTAEMPPELLAERRAEHCLGRFNQADRVAAFIRFLSEELPHSSGQSFNLDSRIL